MIEHGFLHKNKERSLLYEKVYPNLLEALYMEIVQLKQLYILILINVYIVYFITYNICQYVTVVSYLTSLKLVRNFYTGNSMLQPSFIYSNSNSKA